MTCKRCAEYKKAEKLTSDAYLRIRGLVGAWDTKEGGVDRFEVTENKIKMLKTKIAELEEEVKKGMKQALLAERYRKALEDIIMHMDMVAGIKTRSFSTVSIIARQALAKDSL